MNYTRTVINLLVCKYLQRKLLADLFGALCSCLRSIWDRSTYRNFGSGTFGRFLQNKDFPASCLVRLCWRKPIWYPKASLRRSILILSEPFKFRRLSTVMSKTIKKSILQATLSFKNTRVFWMVFCDNLQQFDHQMLIVPFNCSQNTLVFLKPVYMKSKNDSSFVTLSSDEKLFVFEDE